MRQSLSLCDLAVQFICASIAVVFAAVCLSVAAVVVGPFVALTLCVVGLCWLIQMVARHLTDPETWEPTLLLATEGPAVAEEPAAQGWEVASNVVEMVRPCPAILAFCDVGSVARACVALIATNASEEAAPAASEEEEAPVVKMPVAKEVVRVAALPAKRKGGKAEWQLGDNHITIPEIKRKLVKLGVKAPSKARRAELLALLLEAEARAA